MCLYVIDNWIDLFWFVYKRKLGFCIDIVCKYIIINSVLNILKKKLLKKFECFVYLVNNLRFFENLESIVNVFLF